MQADTNHIPDFAFFLNIAQAIATTILIPAAWALVRRLSAIRDHLARINGHIIDLNRWRESHEQLSATIADHHEKTRANCREEHRREFDALWTAVRTRKINFGPPDPHT